jgi:uncharacterized membrane protein YhaH (DUF805 family)
MQSLLFSFQGRINRAKFWLLTIAADIAWIILMGVLFAVVGGSIDADGTPNLGGGAIGALLFLVLLVVFVWIGLAIGVKRWHDRDKSGWWVLIALVPVIGSLWYLIECGFLKGTTGANTYGADPLAPG